MKSVRFDIKIPTQSTAYSWLMEKREGGENMSRAVRLLIETHSDLFDKLTTEENRCEALRRQIRTLQRQDSPDFRANLEAEKDKLARIRLADRDQ
jgi:GTP cyclohydrolase FolE2